MMKIELTKDQTDLIIAALIDKQSDIRREIKFFNDLYDTSKDQFYEKCKTKYEEVNKKYDVLLKCMCVAVAKDDDVLPILSFSSSIKENGNIHTTAETDVFGTLYIDMIAGMTEQDIRDIYEPALNAFKHCTQELVKKIDQ